MEKENLFERVGMTPKNGALTPEQIAKVKGLGCLGDKRFEDVFNVRVLTVNGKITSAAHRQIAEAAERFGSGEVAMTSRQTMEIQGVPYDNIPDLIFFLKEKGIETGGTGPKVRPIVSCKGTTCRFGRIDTFALSEKIHNRFYIGYHGETLPHKFKIAVGGCPNNCVKPELNDLGIIGQCVFTYDPEKCRGCNKCGVLAACPMQAAEVRDGKVHIEDGTCNHCGLCYEKCPFGVLENKQEGYRVYIGGRWGKKTAVGKPLSVIFTTEEEVLAVIEKAILLFRDEGIKGERFADTIQRLGFAYVEEKLI